MTLSQTAINVFYGHELYVHLMGREYCDCEDCAQIRPEIYNRIWKLVKKSFSRT